MKDIDQQLATIKRIARTKKKKAEPKTERNIFELNRWLSTACAAQESLKNHMARLEEVIEVEVQELEDKLSSINKHIDEYNGIEADLVKLNKEVDEKIARHE